MLCSSISRPRIQIIIPQEDLLKKLGDIVMSNQQIYIDGSQNSSKLFMPNKSEVQSDSSVANNELVSENQVEIHENLGMESTENVVRKRTCPLEGRMESAKHVRIASEYDEEMFSSRSESSQSSETLEITDEEQIPKKAGYTLVQEEELRNTDVVDDTTVELNSDPEVLILNKDVVDHELTIQQMMADFVPD